MARKQRVRRSDTAVAAVSDPVAERGPGVTPEERHKLAVSCAFFKAEHYREASPESIRRSDIESAEQAIEDTLKNGGRDAS